MTVLVLKQFVRGRLLLMEVSPLIIPAVSVLVVVTVVVDGIGGWMTVGMVGIGRMRVQSIKLSTVEVV
jgi:hypothetical protein